MQAININIQVDSGNVNITTGGDGKINLNSGGDYNVKVGGDYTMTVAGSRSVSVAGTTTDNISQRICDTGKTIGPLTDDVLSESFIKWGLGRYLNL